MLHPYAHPLADLFAHLLPEIVLVFCACLLFVAALFKTDRHICGVAALGSLMFALARHIYPIDAQDLPGDAVFAVPLLFDSLAAFTRVLALCAGIVFILLCWHDMPVRHVADHHACVLLIIAGICLVGAANDLVALFLALELVSIPTYVLLYLPRHDDDAQEASIKYFLLSVFSSGLLLFGFSYLFGLTGTTNIAGILQVLYGASVAETKAVGGLAQIAMLMIAAGLSFRIAAAPFHFYAPDVFQGTSTSGAAFLSYIPKIAGFIAILRVFGFVVPAGVAMGDRLAGLALSDQVPTLFWFLAALTMTIGNFLGLLQDNLKRLFAYSSIAHAGYMLVAVASAPYLSSGEAATSGVAALLFYLVAYGAMTFGFFAVIAMLNRPERPVETVDDLAGLAKSHPFLALLVTILMLSFIGIPLTAGFTGKLFIFFGAMSVEGPKTWVYPTLAVVGMLNAAIGAWYYLRIVTVMYLRDAVKPIETPGTYSGFATVILCAALTLGLSVPPGASWLLNAARQTTVRHAPPGRQAAQP
jgi:NADH-quinone oxidoreductase subunit N